MEIRRIFLSEHELVTGLFDSYRVFYKQASDPERARRFIRARLENNESIIFVAFDADNVPIGFTQLYPVFSSARTIRNWVLNDLYVDPAWRGRQIGTALIRTALDFAKEDGSAVVRLSTATDNLTAQRLYEFLGFEKTPPETDFISYHYSLNT